MTTQSCDCEPADADDHYCDCPRSWDHCTTAADIAATRNIIMRWNETAAQRHAEGDPFFHNHREGAARMARGVTARAVELGLEAP